MYRLWREALLRLHPQLSVLVRPPGIDLILLINYNTVFQPAGHHSDRLWQRHLLRLDSRIHVFFPKLTLVIHPPCENLPLSAQRNRESLSHFQILDLDILEPRKRYFCWNLEQHLFLRFLDMLGVPNDTPEVDLSVLGDAPRVGHAAAYSDYLAEAGQSVDLLEVVKRFLGAMAEGEGASMTAGENTTLIGTDKGMNSSASNLLNLLL